MAAYIYASIDLTDPVAYEQYRQRVPALIAAHGGRYLVRGGAARVLVRQQASSGHLIALLGV
jgi:uncharacterized protein (DUF1330 family)